MTDQIDVEAMAQHLLRQRIRVTPCPERYVELKTAAGLLGLSLRGLEKRIEEGRAPEPTRLVTGGRRYYPLGDVLAMRKSAAQTCENPTLRPPTAPR